MLAAGFRVMAASTVNVMNVENAQLSFAYCVLLMKSRFYSASGRINRDYKRFQLQKINNLSASNCGDSSAPFCRPELFFDCMPVLHRQGCDKRGNVGLFIAGAYRLECGDAVYCFIGLLVKGKMLAVSAVLERIRRSRVNHADAYRTNQDA